MIPTGGMGRGVNLMPTLGMGRWAAGPVVIVLEAVAAHSRAWMISVSRAWSVVVPTRLWWSAGTQRSSWAASVGRLAWAAGGLSRTAWVAAAKSRAWVVAVVRAWFTEAEE